MSKRKFQILVETLKVVKQKDKKKLNFWNAVVVGWLKH